MDTTRELRALSALNDNYIWLLGAGERTVVVDPGDAAPVFAAGIVPAAVLITHHHPDHIGGLPALLQRWPHLPVYAPHEERIPLATQRVVEGQRIELDGCGFEVIETPGHTRSHVSYLSDDGRLFCGDVLFSLGCGRFFEGTPEQALVSIDKLARLTPVTVLCCAHEYTAANAAFAVTVEPANEALLKRAKDVEQMRNAGKPTLPSTLASELACNPFLRTQSLAVMESLRPRLGRLPHDRIETLAELRRWKDGFTA